jgi:hypothetical protein
MACPTGRCALRRFDGHGTSSYRPTNTEAVRQFNSSLEAMMAERAKQDSGVFEIAPAGAPASSSPFTPVIPKGSISISSNECSKEKCDYYSLSDTTKSK